MKNKVSQSARKASDAFLVRHFGSVNSSGARDFNFGMNLALLLDIPKDEIPELFAEKFGAGSPLHLAAQDVVRAAKAAKSQAEYEILLAEGTLVPIQTPVV